MSQISNVSGLANKVIAPLTTGSSEGETTPTPPTIADVEESGNNRPGGDQFAENGGTPPAPMPTQPPAPPPTNMTPTPPPAPANGTPTPAPVTNNPPANNAPVTIFGTQYQTNGGQVVRNDLQESFNNESTTNINRILNRRGTDAPAFAPLLNPQSAPESIRIQGDTTGRMHVRIVPDSQLSVHQARVGNSQGLMIQMRNQHTPGRFDHIFVEQGYLNRLSFSSEGRQSSGQDVMRALQNNSQGLINTTGANFIDRTTQETLR